MLGQLGQMEVLLMICISSTLSGVLFILREEGEVMWEWNLKLR